MRKTRIVIVNFRTPGLVVDCLHSLKADIRNEPDCRVIVVDNASGDDSVNRLTTTIKAAGWMGRGDAAQSQRRLLRRQ
jgi:GT2 family glycosyltransferase